MLLIASLLCCLGAVGGDDPSGEAVPALLDNNLRCVDLSDLASSVPLALTRSIQILQRTEAWEHNSWDGRSDDDSLGYPTVVKNDRGKNPDGKYYLYYAHHDPCSGIGCAVADSIAGPYRKLADLDAKRQHSMALVNPHYPARHGDPSHFSSPCAVWNEEEKLWFMYFHYWNHFHQAWEAKPLSQGAGHQMTALATCPDLAANEWTVEKDPSVGKVSVHDILPVLPTTKEPWMSSQSSYHAIQRLPDGEWLAFLRGTPVVDNIPKLGFARSKDGRRWDYSPRNPAIHQNDGGGGEKGIYRAYFVGYLGKDRSGKRQYLLVWGESPASGDVPKVMYGYTTDFVNVKRDPRGYAKWTGGDGPISPWREGNRLYLFQGKQVHIMFLPTDPLLSRLALTDDQLKAIDKLKTIGDDLRKTARGALTADQQAKFDAGLPLVTDYEAKVKEAVAERAKAVRDAAGDQDKAKEAAKACAEKIEKLKADLDKALDEKVGRAVAPALPERASGSRLE